MPTAVIYARISKDDANDGLGVARQEKLCRKLAAERGLEVVDVFVDNDVSAYSRKPRPQFERLVNVLRADAADALIVYHPDRLYRRNKDLERLVDIIETTRAQVHTVAAGDTDLTTASGRFSARIVGSAAQHESERLGERQKVKNDERAAKGQPPGGRPPYGYTAGYVVNPVEAKAVNFMARRVLEGSSLLGLARELDAQGVTTREGRPWHSTSVRASLINPAIAGLRIHRREIAGLGNWDPVLDRATWEEVRAVLTDPARKHKRPARKYLLAGLVFTSSGDQMTGRPDRGGGDVTDRRTYATRYARAAGNPAMSIGAEDLEAVVVEAVLRVLDKAALPTAVVTTTGAADVEAIEAEIAELAALRGSGQISLAEWMAARTPLLDRLAEALTKAGTARRPSPQAKLLSKPGAARRAWPDLEDNITARREIIGSVVERVVIGPAFRERWTTIAERLDPEKGYGIIWKV